MSIILAMSLFSLSMSISPGPVNFITLSTGANHGFRSAVPFVSGATICFTLLLLLIGMGLGQLAEDHAAFLDLLGYGGSALICYMGYKIATSDPREPFESGIDRGFQFRGRLRSKEVALPRDALALRSSFDVEGYLDRSKGGARGWGVGHRKLQHELSLRGRYELEGVSEGREGGRKGGLGHRALEGGTPD